MARPSISDPKSRAKATSTVCSASPSSSKAIDRVKIMISVRRTKLVNRGEGQSALTVANSAAREKKLAASNPKNRTKKAAKSRGKKPKKFEM